MSLEEIARHPAVERLFEASRGGYAVYLNSDETLYVAVALAVIARVDPALVVPLRLVPEIRATELAIR